MRPSVELSSIIDTAFPADGKAARDAALARQDKLTKPAGSLGRLETLAVALAERQGRSQPKSRPASALIFAADHPVTALGVSAYPSAVTRAMVQNFATGGAAASVLASTFGVPLTVVDVGVSGPVAEVDGPHARVVRAPRAGKGGDLLRTDALDADARDAALRAGRDAVDALDPETRVLVLGEMGIGNTTCATALSAALLETDGAALVGPGTGVHGEALETKKRVVRGALERVGQVSPGEALRRLGGRDIAAVVGAAGRAAALGMTVLVDGFIVTSAILALCRLRPAARGAFLFAHRSAEPGHSRQLEALDAEPLLDLGLRLGEASGALTALPILDAACALHSGMATFEGAGVPEG